MSPTARAALAAQLAAILDALPRPAAPAPVAIVRPDWLRRLEARRP